MRSETYKEMQESINYTIRRLEMLYPPGGKVSVVGFNGVVKAVIHVDSEFFVVITIWDDTHHPEDKHVTAEVMREYATMEGK